jgi:hypothetical protein
MVYSRARSWQPAAFSVAIVRMQVDVGTSSCAAVVNSELDHAVMSAMDEFARNKYQLAARWQAKK